MTYPSYPEYKDSNVIWLGNIPSHWAVCAVWVGFELGRGRVISNEEIQDNLGDYPVYSSQTENNGELGCINTYDFEGDFLTWTTDGANAGTVFERHGRFNCTNVCGTLKPRNNDWNLTFYRHALDVASGWFVRHDINPKLMNNVMSAIRIPKLPYEEQTQIATFLDRETQKIDRLIEKQQQLIKLLQEKRQAVISHAVTKGLNPGAKMKDSGVEWLGEIPEHWETRRIKTLFKIRKRISGELGHDVLSITQQGIKIKDIESGEGQLSMDYSKYQLVNVGDFAMNHMDLLTGWVDISKYDGVTSPDYRVFALVDDKSDTEYYLYVLQMGYNEKIFYAFGQGSSHLGRWRFPTENFKDFIFPYPPQNEQKQISTFIKSEHNRIACLIKKCSKAIELLQERRTALISAAVTGKIDVRNIAVNDTNSHTTEQEAIAL